MLSKEDKIKLLEVNIKVKKDIIENLIGVISYEGGEFDLGSSETFEAYKKDCEYIIEVLEKEKTELKSWNATYQENLKREEKFRLETARRVLGEDEDETKRLEEIKKQNKCLHEWEHAVQEGRYFYKVCYLCGKKDLKNP